MELSAEHLPLKTFIHHNDPQLYYIQDSVFFFFCKKYFVTPFPIL